MISTTVKHPVKIFPEIQTNNASRLFVFAEARSGSTWLINTLSSHPEIGLMDEVINPDYVRNMNLFQRDKSETFISITQSIDNLLSSLKGRYKGCKILFPQAIRFIDFYEFILNNRNAHFILLTRKNSIRAEISGLIANIHSRWHLEEKKDKEQISVSPAFLLERLLWRKYSKDFCINIINAHCQHVLSVEYSELFENTASSLSGISEFLGVAPSLFTFSKEIKSNPFSLKEVVLNYQDCIDFFLDKPEYAEFFEKDNISE